MLLENPLHSMQKHGDLGGQAIPGVGLCAEDLPAEHQVAAQVIEGDHRGAIANQGVIRVVPFRPLRVQPDAGLGDEVGKLDEQGDQELLGQIYQAHIFLLVPDEFAICAPGPHPSLDEFFNLWIKDDRVFWVCQQVVVGLDAVGDVGAGKDFPREEAT